MPRAWRYRPANTQRDLSPEARKLGRRAMDDFLLSPQVLRPTIEAANDVADAARELTVAEGHVDTGDFVSKFDVGVGEIMTIDGNPRVTARVHNDSAHAAAVEFLSPNKGGHGFRILGRAAQPWHSPKGPA